VGLLAELTGRGIAEPQARKLLFGLPQTQYVLDQLEWGDHLIAQASPGKFYNPAGFYIHLIKENILPPDSFECSRRKRLRREAREAQSRAHEEEARRELAYEEYRKREITKHLSANYSGDEYGRLFDLKKKELLRQYGKQLSNWDEATLQKLVESTIESYIAKLIPLLGFAEFCEQHEEQPSLFQ
jgi:hypothetical protein